MIPRYRGLGHLCYVGPCLYERIPGCAYCAEHELHWIAAGNKRSRVVWGFDSSASDYSHWKNAYQDLLDREDPVGFPRA